MEKDSKNIATESPVLLGGGVARSDRDGHPGADSRLHRDAGGRGAERGARPRATSGPAGRRAPRWPRKRSDTGTAGAFGPATISMRARLSAADGRRQEWRSNVLGL